MNSCKRKQDAYLFLRSFLSQEYQMHSMLRSLPVRKDCIKTRSAKISDLDVREQYENTIQNSATLKLNYALLETFYNYMLPYYEGKKSYQACYQEFGNYLQIYVSE